MTQKIFYDKPAAFALIGVLMAEGLNRKRFTVMATDDSDAMKYRMSFALAFVSGMIFALTAIAIVVYAMLAFT